MNLPDFMLALVLMGLPLACMSWFMFSWLYLRGDLDRDADPKALGKSLKSLKKKRNKTDDRYGAGFLLEKWGWFGGGFYGLAGLWTFAVTEAVDIWQFVWGFDVAALIERGPIGLLIDFLLNQLLNLLTALLWFTWWPADSMLVWILVAYLAYWGGIELARRQRGPELEQLREKGQGMRTLLGSQLKALRQRFLG